MVYGRTANLKRKPRLSKFESYKAANSNSKEVQFCLTSVFVSCVVCRVAHVLLMLIDTAAPVRRSGRTCRLTLLGAWVLVNAKALLKE